jgi:hypothetical protein
MFRVAYDLAGTKIILNTENINILLLYKKIHHYILYITDDIEVRGIFTESKWGYSSGAPNSESLKGVLTNIKSLVEILAHESYIYIYIKI